MIEICNLTRYAIDAAFFRKVAKDIFKKEKVKLKHLSLALVGPKRAQELNRMYRKKNYVPSVLSFPYGPPPLGRRGSPPWGGEIILCPAKIRKDARKYGILFEQELVRVFSHGLLHILGYSHKQMQKFAPSVDGAPYRMIGRNPKSQTNPNDQIPKSKTYRI